MSRWPKDSYHDSSRGLQGLTLTNSKLTVSAVGVVIDVATGLHPQTSPFTLRMGYPPYFSGCTCYTTQSTKRFVCIPNFASIYQNRMKVYRICNEYPHKCYHVCFAFSDFLLAGSNKVSRVVSLIQTQRICNEKKNMILEIWVLSCYTHL